MVWTVSLIAWTEDRIAWFAQIIEEIIKNLDEDILFIVGAEKVPPWVFELADYNIAVGNQPHSEIAALAIAMNNFHPISYNLDFSGRLSVIPSATHRNMRDSIQD